MRQHRRTLSRAKQAHSAQQVCLRTMRTRWWHAAKRIAFYWPADGEVSLLPLLRESLRRGKQCYLPAIENKYLAFHEFRCGHTLKRNRYGIPEPWKTPACAVNQLDVIFMPLVAFDAQCNRLGMGAGFYDRTLAARTIRRNTMRIGIAHEFQKVAHLPIDPWDVPLHAVITDSRTYFASKI